MSVTANVTSVVQVIESINNLGTTTNFNHTELNEIFQNLGDSSTPSCQQVAVLYQDLTAGAATLNLTSLSAMINGYTHTVDGSNGGGTSVADKVQFVKFLVPTTAQITARGGSHTQSGSAITIKYGASNPYNLAGSLFQIALKPGQSALFSLNDGAPQVLTTQKNLDLSGSGTDELWVIFVLGGSF